MTRSVIWRVMGIAILALITFLVTGSWIQTTLITFLHHGAFIIIYYLHERLWCRIHGCQGKKRKVLRAFTYEIVLGHLVLGLITLAVTGSWLSVTLVTIIYIENKLWIYVVYDWIWDKVRWQTFVPVA